MATLTWLHLSDAHLPPASDDAYDAEVVLDALCRSLGGEAARGWRPDLVFFTGDLADRVQDYTRAGPFFDTVLEATGLGRLPDGEGRRRLFVVPGNHDVERAKCSGMPRPLHKKSDSDLFFAPASAQDRDPYFHRFDAYAAFFNGYFNGIRSFSTENHYCAEVIAVDGQGVRAGVVGLNSAWFSQDDGDMQKLWIGERTCREALGRITSLGGADLIFVIHHHPHVCLHREESRRVRGLIHATADVALYGHIHEEDTEHITDQFGSILRFQSGAVWSADEDGHHCRVLLGRADLSRRRVTIRPLTYQDAGTGHWTLDTSLYPSRTVAGHEGEFDLPERTGESPEQRLEPETQRSLEPTGPSPTTGEPAPVAAMPARTGPVPSLPLGDAPASGGAGGDCTWRETAWDAKVQVARDQMQKGMLRTAREILLGVRTELVGQATSEDLRFRITANIGICALHLDDLATAREELGAAVALRPDDPVALAHCAILSLVEGDPGRALDLCERAREAEGRAPLVMSVYLQALHANGKKCEIERVLAEERWVQDEPDCLLALGHLAMRDEDYDRSEGLLRAYIRENPSDPKGHAALASAIMFSTQARMRQDPPLPWRGIPDAELARLREAEDQASQALESFTRQEQDPLLRGAWITRSAIRLARDAAEDALADCDAVLRSEPGNLAGLHNKGLALMRLGRLPQAAECLSGVRGPVLGVGVDLQLATCYLGMRCQDQAIGILTPVWEEPPEGDLGYEVAGLMLEALHALGQSDGVEDAVRRIERRWPDDPKAMLVVARQRWREGKPGDVEEILRRAIGLSAGRTRGEAVAQLADILYQQEKYGEAADFYRQVATAHPDDHLLPRYVASLVNSGTYGEALRVAKQVRASGRVVPAVAEAEAQLLEYASDYEGARAIWAELAELEPDRVSHRIRWARSEMRQNRMDVARQVATSIGDDQVDGDAEAMLHVAMLRAYLQLPGVAPLAYRARALAMDDPAAHLTYVTLLLQQERLWGAEAPQQIGIDCTVTLTRGTERLEYTLVGEPSANNDTREIAVTSPLAQELLGHRAGEQVVFRRGQIDEAVYEVAGVRTKYVAALHETLAQFPTRFPSNRDLQRIEVPPGDLSRVWAMLDRRHDHAVAIEQLYQQHKLPLGTFAHLLGIHPVEAWSGRVATPGFRLFASSGNAEEAHRETEGLVTSSVVVADLTALLTLAHLGLLERLTQRFSRVLSARPVLDEIDSLVADTELRGESGGTLGRDGNGYFYRETTPEMAEQNRRFLMGLREFLTSAVSLVPVTEALRLGKDRFEQAKRVLGEYAIGGILVAREHDALLYADDLGLRRVAGSDDWQVACVWTQSFLTDLRQRGAITAAEYHDAIRKLILAGYHFVSIRAEGVLWALERNAFRVNDEVEIMFSALRGPECRDAGAITVLADVIGRVYTERLLTHQQHWILDLSLRTLVTGRNPRDVLGAFRTALRRQTRLQLAPQALARALSGMDLWVRVRPL